MPSAVIGALRVSLGLDSAEFRAGAARAQSAANNLAGRIQRSFTGIANSGRALGGVLANLSGPLALLTGAGGVAGLVAIADEAKSITSQLKLATAQTGSFIKAQEDVARIASATRGGLAETASLYGNFVRATNEMGKTQGDAARATETFAKALKIGGADANAAASATLQFGQALASGVLRGDEFNSIMEASPRIARLLADSLGIPIGQLRNMAQEGKLTSDVLFNALTNRKFTDGLDAEFQQLPVTFGEAMTLVHNAAIATFGAFDDGGQFSTALANFIGRGSDGFASLAEAAAAEGIHIRSTFEGLSDAFSPLLSGAQSAFAGVRQEADYTRTSIISILKAFDDLRNLYVDAQNFGSRIENSVKGALNRAQRRAGAGPNADVAMTPILARSNTAQTFAVSQRRSSARLRIDRAARRLEADGYIVPRNADGTVNEAGIRRRERPAPRVSTPAPAKPSGEKKGGSGRSPEAEQAKQEREAKRIAEKEARDQRRFEAAEASERDAQLRARADLTVEARDRLAVEKQLRDNETAARLRTIETDKDLTDEQKARLSALVKGTAALEEEAAQRRAQQDQQRQDLERVTAANENQQDILSAQSSLARTSKERAALELQILDLQFKQQRAVQEAVIASVTATDQEKAIARERLATIDRLQVLGRAQVRRQNAGPLARYLDAIPKTGAEINEAMEGVAVDGLDNLIGGIAKAKGDFKQLGDVVSSVADDIIASLLRIGLQKGIAAIFGSLFGGSSSNNAVAALFGDGGSGGTGLVTAADPLSVSLGKIGNTLSGARARGGSVVGGRNYLVGEMGPEIFTASRSGNIIANDDIPMGGARTVNQTINFSGAVDLATRTEVYRVADAARVAAMNGIREQDRRRG